MSTTRQATKGTTFPARLALVAALLGTAAACGDRPRTMPEPAAADLVLITVDTLRADVLGFMGGRPEVSPALDRLAARGRVFTFAHAHNVVTLPSHASILTGRLPFEHGVRANSGFVLPEGVATLAEMLSAEGFATAAFVSAYPLDSRFGLDRGFEVYDDGYRPATGARTFLYAERPADETVAAARAWWRATDDRRRFAWIHLFDPHYPYEPPPKVAARFPDDPYLGEVAAVDRALAPFLASLESDGGRPAVVAFTSDHGEALGDHGEETHGLFAYEATLWVPLVIAGPGIAPGRDGRSAAHVDLLPTLLDALGAGLGVGDELAGRSLLAAASQDGPPVYFESLTTNLTNGWAPLRGLLADRMKYIDLPLPELYDLGADPAEADNLVASSRPTVARLRALLPEESTWPPVAGETTIEEQTMLRGLGYLAGRARSKREYGVEDDPKNLLELDQKLQRMIVRYAAGDRARAAELAQQVLARRPETPMAYSMLAQVLLDEGRREEAVEFMRATRERGLATDALDRQLALTLVELGRGGEAIELVAPLVAAERARPEVEDLLTYGLALSGSGRQEEAAAALERALVLDPGAAHVLEASALVALRREQFGQAAERARRALARDDTRAASWNILGVALHSADEPGALEAWQRCVDLEPSHFDALFNLGVVAAELGRPEVAAQALERFVAQAPAAVYESDIATARRLLAGLEGASG